MWGYLFRRLMQSLLILLGISLVTFVLLYLVPADPARQIAGRSATAETVANIRAQLGLDQPFYVQYGRYLGNLLQGDLGRSYLQRTEVSTLIWARMPATLLLMLGAIVAELVMGLTIGAVAALKRNTPIDQSLMVFSFVTISAPQFVVGILLLYVFAVRLGWFPIGGYGTFAHLVLPALTIGLLGTGWYSRMMRSSMIDVLAHDYVRTARAKGLSEWTVVMVHVLRNSMIPVVTVIALGVPHIFGGAIITEQIFKVNGLGQLLITAIQANDLPMVQTVTFMIAGLIVLFNIVADVLYGVLDPRIRYD